MVRLISILLAVVMLNDPAAAPGWRGAALVATAPGAPVRVGAYAVFRANCTIGPVPEIRLQQPPRNGTVELPDGTMTTSRLPRCPGLTAPARVLVYRPNPGFVGLDDLGFEVVNPGARQIEHHAVTVAVGNAALRH